MKKILIVEDDIVLREELAKFLTHSSYQVDVLTDFQDVVSSILLSQVDMVLLDINLPNQNGEFILKKLRLESNVPVIMLTSYNNDSDEVLSMSYGADDYITKPYNPTILLLRMEAIWKRYDKNSTLLNYESIVLNMDRGIILFEGKDYYLTKNEMLILKYFILHRNKIVPREDLMRYLWDSEEFIDDNTLSVNISRLRRKLSEVGLVDVIETRKGIGYLLK
ncbi:MAG: response regulator transcription factor [Bacilli bacterium]|jgi:two-component system response regulator protein GraR|nr:response regulator transcription factor [Bacilli bacterium]